MISENLRLKDRIAFITGAGTGIGKAISLRLAKEGADVIATDINPDTVSKTAHEISSLTGRQAHFFILDVSNSHEVEQVIDKAWNIFGRIDLLINNAGVSTMNYVWELTEKDWDYNMNVNAKGVFLVTVATLKRMIRYNYVKKPKIVNIASIAGKIPAPFLAHYTASKFAVVGFTKAVALEVAKFGINVNAVCPGFVQTSMQEREVVWEAKLRGITPDEVRKGYLSQIPLGRLETPEDVAKVVAFLCSDDADYITGQAINVDGGVVMF
jgi:meso-butanediol dehydrogenase/(S,S)-butanediol dehydrogenase/diacetyl reductase